MLCVGFELLMGELPPSPFPIPPSPSSFPFLKEMKKESILVSRVPFGYAKFLPGAFRPIMVGNSRGPTVQIPGRWVILWMSLGGYLA